MAELKKTKKSWGGRRPGAGRKRKRAKAVGKTIYLSPRLWLQLEAMCEKKENPSGRIARWINEEL